MLQLKARGDNPSNLSDTVVPTLDLTHWYGAESPTVQVASTAITTTAKYATVLDTAIKVPDNEIWWCRSLTAVLVPNVATVIQLRALQAMVRLRQKSEIGTPLQGIIAGESAPPYDSATMGVPTIGAEFPSPSISGFWMPPGANAAVYFCGSVTDPGTPNVYAFGNFDRFLI